jgi:hypothetical protein
VFDLLGIVSLLNKNKVVALCGGRLGEHRRILDSLFQRLSSVAELVFFKDGIKMKEKQGTKALRTEQKQERWLEVYEKVREGKSLEEIVSSSNIPYLLGCKFIAEKTVKSYGKTIYSVTKECDAEIAKYATENSSVIAVLGDDTDFLIFGGSWRYWSIREIDIESLSTKEYSRNALRNELNLDDQQLAVLSTIAGNDFVRFDEVVHCHRSTFGVNTSVKFRVMAKYIRENVNTEDLDLMMKFLAGFLLGCQSPENVERIKNSIELYKTVSSLVKYKTKIYFHICRILKSMITKTNPFCQSFVSTTDICRFIRPLKAFQSPLTRLCVTFQPKTGLTSSLWTSSSSNGKLESFFNMVVNTVTFSSRFLPKDQEILAQNTSPSQFILNFKFHP